MTIRILFSLTAPLYILWLLGNYELMRAYMMGVAVGAQAVFWYVEHRP